MLNDSILARVLAVAFGCGLALSACSVEVDDEGDRDPDDKCASDCDDAQITCEGDCDDEDDECFAGCSTDYDDCSSSCE